MAINDIVDLQITVANPIVTRAGFGTVLILSSEAVGKFSGASKLYTSADELLDDGFLSSGITYKLAQILQSQNPAPSSFKVGRRTESSGYNTEYKLKVQPGTVGDVYSVKFNGVLYSFTRPDGYTDDQVSDELGLLIEADTSVAVTYDPETIILVNNTDDTGIQFSDVQRLSIHETTILGNHIADDLNLIYDYDPDFYGVILDQNCNDAILQAAAWVESKRKILFYESADPACWDTGSTTDIFSKMKALSYANSVGVWSDTPNSGLAAAWLGKIINYEPGVVNPAHKTLSGVPTSNIKAYQQTAIKNKRGNYYTAIAGQGTTWDGITPSGEFIDTISLVHFLYARITEDVVAALRANIKIPYTNAGIAVITSVINARLRSKIGSGIAGDPPPQVTAPRVSDINSADKQARKVPNIKFVALLDGAINSTKITGTVTVDETVFTGGV